MLDHIAIHVSDYAAARDFYAAALEPLGFRLGMEPVPGAGGFTAGDRPGQGFFPLWLYERRPVTAGHVAITAASRAAVDAFHAAALAAGAQDNGEPGLRTLYHPDYYGAYVLTADGLNLEAVCHRA